jgi:7-carboxy-7-deazaguanine synthase
MSNLKNDVIYLSDDKIFYTIEGEGEYIGTPSVFMRLSMCNLTCKAFATADSPHGCDSYISWKVKNKFTFEEIAKLIETEGYKEHLANDAIFKITGGEPLIQQQKLEKLIDYLLDVWDIDFRIDFETNGTILPNNYWVDRLYSATFTVSPKLTNNGDPEHKRYKPEALQYHADIGSGFKFVINIKDDINEVIEKYVNKFCIPNNRVWLMPCCGSREEHIEKAPMVADLAKQYNFNFSPRLQLLIWNKALKV